MTKRTVRPKGKRRRGYAPRRKVCHFCAGKIGDVDYKEVSRLQPFLSNTWKIEKRRKKGTCARHERSLARAVKRARHLALLPYAPSHSAGMAAKPESSG